MTMSLNAFFFFNDPATTEIYTLSLHDALPISRAGVLEPAPADGDVARAALHLHAVGARRAGGVTQRAALDHARSEEHTSELQSQSNLVCRLLLEKKNTSSDRTHHKLNNHTEVN